MQEKCETMDGVHVFVGEVPLPPPLPPLLSPVTPSPAPQDYLALPRVGDGGVVAALPTNKLRPLYWEKLQDDSSGSDNIWSTLPTITPDAIDQKELQKLFHARRRKSSSSSLSSSISGTRHTVRLLTPKKSQALAIMLRNLPDGVELKEMIANLDCEAIDPSILVALADVVCTCMTDGLM